jgi:hypothetical protein
MKKFLILMLGLLLTVAVSGIASADLLSFSNTKDWNDSYLNGRQAKLIDNTNIGDAYPFTWSQTITFTPPAEKILTASLTLTHWGSELCDEAWFLTDSGNVKLGSLKDSSRGWVDQTFDLKGLFESVTGATWTIGFKLYDASKGWDFLALDKVKLAGTYNSVPEPGTFLLLGLGLVGLAGYGRKKFKKA